MPILVSYLVILFGGKYPEEFQVYFGIVGALSWMTFYTLRFRKKDSKKFIDYLKLIIALLFGLAIMESSFGFIEAKFIFISALLLHPIYIIDRFVLNARRKFSYVLTALGTLVTVFFVVFANIQTDLAKETQSINEHLALEIFQLKEKSSSAAVEAQKVQSELDQKLEECQESK